MFTKKSLMRWSMIAIAIVLILSSLSVVYAAGETAPNDEDDPSLSQAGFHDLFEVEITPDISDGVDLGEDVVVTVRGRELPDGTRVGIDGDRYINPEVNDRPVPAMINVTNVLWDGTPWYAEYDDTVWHRNDTEEKYFRRVSPHEVELTIWSELPEGEGYQFPAGCEVSFHLYVGNKTREDGRWVNKYLESREYEYEVGGAFPDSPVKFPDAPNQELFERNIDLTREPEEPNIQEDVEFNITSESDEVNLTSASLYLEAHYGPVEVEYYQYFFDPTEGSWPSRSATVTIPGEEWHEVAGTEIKFRISARDDHGNQVVTAEDFDEVTEDYTYEVQSVGEWEHDDFARDIDLNTEPDLDIHDELSRTASVEVTITSGSPNVPIENAYLYYNITDTWHGVPLEGQWQMEQESSTEWSYVIPPQSAGVNVNFYVRAWDITGSMIESDEYSYSIEEEEENGDDGPAPPGQTYFEMTVYDAEIDEFITDVEVVIGNGTWETTTYTDISGRTYPNVTGEDTPQFLALDEPYYIEVYYPYEEDNETEEMVRIEYTPRHHQERNETEVLYDEGNLVVTRVNNTLEFEYNSPPEPPEFADIYQGYNIYTLIVVFIVVGMAIPVGWRLYIITEEGKQERSLVK